VLRAIGSLSWGGRGETLAAGARVTGMFIFAVLDGLSHMHPRVLCGTQIGIEGGGPGMGMFLQCPFARRAALCCGDEVYINISSWRKALPSVVRCIHHVLSTCTACISCVSRQLIIDRLIDYAA
jgi:hypothetical protein